MIVRRAADRLQLITQPDHAQLAGTIMECCVALKAEPRRDAILHAIYAHDNGWLEEDQSPRLNPESGDIFDFVSAPLSVRQAVWPRGVMRLGKEAWTAALIAQHAITVYDRFRPNREWSAFFAGMEAERDARLEVSRLPLENLIADYRYVRLGDLISLTFCTGWRDDQRFGEHAIRLSGDHVIVSPDLFGGTTIPIDITAREIQSQRFESDAMLGAALRAANTIVLRGEVSGAWPA
jgi:Protein of unknown function (DUF3891)